jgi:hypothetical protein
MILSEYVDGFYGYQFGRNPKHVRSFLNAGGAHTIDCDHMVRIGYIIPPKGGDLR